MTSGIERVNDQSSLVHHVQPNGFVVDQNDKRCITTPVWVFLEAIGNVKRTIIFSSRSK
jgi:hypothetical protein